MLRSILVPLDGSAFGEQALPVALRIAERLQARIDLVLVHDAVPPYGAQGAPAHDPRLDNERRRERARYLDVVADWLRQSTTVPVVATLLDGPVARRIAEHVAARGPELVIMTTHGRGGLGRALIGSVADELTRRATVPLLLLRPDMHGSRESAPRAVRRVLVPLDGSPPAEEAIEVALEIVGAQGVTYSLMHVLSPALPVPTGDGIVPVPETVTQEEREAAERYLAALAKGLRARGVDAEAWTLFDRAPARAIADCAADVGADLIAMATHARGGMARLLAGSVAGEVVRSCRIPVLLVRRADAETMPWTIETVTMAQPARPAPAAP
jgi:nucleotide-binding universal stress UspA family protein